ncbi:MFS transporter [Salinactinospora qingdaonensis]|uniref:MFS transporter n=1 Tax=Salinactinospora qingdaonensis TaxID=702744 RepID=A0ABP7FF95_9ACTN
MLESDSEPAHDTGDRSTQTLPASPHSRTRLRAARGAVSVIFFCTGTVFATWAARVPAVRDNLGLSAGELAIALIGLSSGALVALPIVGGIVARFGSRLTLLGGATLYLGALPLLAVAPNLAALTALLATFACGNTCIDVAMNTQGVLVERCYRRAMMGTFHALFSFGGICGAVVGSAVAHVPVGPHFLATSLVLALAYGTAVVALLPETTGARTTSGAPLLALPKRGLWVCGLIAFCALMGEGVMNDWGAVYLRDITGAAASTAAAGFAVFSAGMVAGRLAADRIRARTGTVRFLLACAVTGATGTAVFVGFPSPYAGLAGYALLGLGLAAVIPVIFSYTAQHNPKHPGSAIAAVSAVGYTGFLVGPPVIGGIAELSDLRVAMLVTLCLMVATFVLSRRLRRS